MVNSTVAIALVLLLDNDRITRVSDMKLKMNFT
jgi:hypothetical protein